MRLKQNELKALFEKNKALAARNQALTVLGTAAQLSGVEKPRPKYGNAKVEYEGMKFDSKHELRCWKILKLREKAAEIDNLTRQVPFVLLASGRRIGRFTVDFMWRENGHTVVADAKSPATRKETAYRLRKKMFEAQYVPLVIREL